MIKVNFLDEVVIKKDSVIHGFIIDLVNWLLWLGVSIGLLFYISVLFRIKIL